MLLNALFLDPGVSGGPETYLRGLVGGFVAKCPELRVTVATTGRGADSLSSTDFGAGGIEVVGLPCEEGQRVRRQAAEQLLLPLLARRTRVDVLHSLASVAPIRVPGVPHVITLHDVNFMRNRTFGRVTRWGMSQVIPRAARNATALITASEVARDDIATTIGISPERLAVIHNGVTPPGRANQAELSPLLRKLGIEEPSRLVLSVGAIRPHKNQELLVRALPELPDDVSIICVGHRESGAKELEALSARLGVAGRFSLPGYLSDSELEALWEHASVAAFPTFAEGFGIPVADSLARGIPVACSDIPVLREVGVGLPTYFDPQSPQSAARAIKKLLADPPDRETLIARGNTFSWNEAAVKTRAVYDRAILASGGLS